MPKIDGQTALALTGLLLLAIGVLATFSRQLERWADAYRAWRAAGETEESPPPPVKHSGITRAMLMSSQGGSEPRRTGSEDHRTTPVRADTYQAEPAAAAKPNDAPAPLVVSHNMSDKELTLLLAAQKGADGKPRWSSNEIAKMMGGTRQHVLDTIALVRPRPAPVEPEKPGRLERPAAGWAVDEA